MLIATSNSPVEVGKTQTFPCLTDPTGKPFYNVRLTVLRVATREEYMAQDIVKTPLRYFYLIVMD